MNAFLIKTNGITSEWLETFHEVQVKMNILAEEGNHSNVTVEKFVNSRLTKSINYNYNGSEWIK